jgi:uncharacterized protein YndB with AHSA1/START domain
VEFCEIRYTRQYAAPPSEVWAALTEPESVALTPHRDGTVLVLDHRRINAVGGMGYMERWLPTLARLDEVLAR